MHNKIKDATGIRRTQYQCNNAENNIIFEKDKKFDRWREYMEEIFDDQHEIETSVSEGS